MVASERVRSDAALLYRLTGDSNPLHVDARVARSVGFPGPILHGLCTFGYAVRAVLGAFGCDARALGCRFSSPVMPGDSLETRMWREGPELVLFEVWVGSKRVLSGGVCKCQAVAKM